MTGWRGPEVAGEVPTLGYLVNGWIEAHCVVPDGQFRGEAFRVSNSWQGDFFLHLYRLHVDAHERYLPDSTRRDWTRPSRAFVYDRGGQVVMPKKAGKGPMAAAWVCVEGGGPALFDGWAERPGAYRCVDHGCRCGWEFPYRTGDPTGHPWPTPWIEVTAASEDQADNVWRVLLPMIREGPLGAEWPDVGETRINLPNHGLVVPVTASARSRQGARATAAVQDESQSWTKRNGGYKLAAAQRDNLAGMGGRFLETDNAWDPSEESVAEQTHTKGVGVYKLMGDAGPGSVRNKRDRARMLDRLYGPSWWVDRDRISVEIDDKIALGDVAAAERLYLNRIVPGEDRAVEPRRWEACRVDPRDVSDARCGSHPRDNTFHDRGCARALVTIGVDGARYVDALAVVATEVESGYQWPLGVWERPEGASDDYEHPLDEVDGAVTEGFDRYNVWRLYVDPGSQVANISVLAERWQGRWGEKRVIVWLMNRPRLAALMVRSYVAAISVGDVKHPGHPAFTRHVENARRKPVDAYDEDGRRLWTVSKEFPASAAKIDAFAAAALSWEARGDAVAAGATGQKRRSAYADQLCRCGRPETPHLKRAHS